ncbi:MAG: YceI family protein [Janthinobacterium lividum]
MLLKQTLFTAALFVATGTALAQSSTWTVETAHSGAEFSIRHLGVSNVHGKIGGLKGVVVWDAADPAKSHVEATMDANSVDTGEPRRDGHLKSETFFDVAKYPTITFKSTAVKRNGEGKLQIIGDLTLGGQTKPVTLDVDGPAAPQPGPNGKTLSGFSATGVISRENFNFGQDVKYKPPVLGDEVKFTIDLEVAKQQ